MTRMLVRTALWTAAVTAVFIGGLWLLTDGPRHTAHDYYTQPRR